LPFHCISIWRMKCNMVSQDLGPWQEDISIQPFSGLSQVTDSQWAIQGIGRVRMHCQLSNGFPWFWYKPRFLAPFKSPRYLNGSQDI
jgi:hypothetical protein